jgi:hypothetical protein
MSAIFPLFAVSTSFLFIKISDAMPTPRVKMVFMRIFITFYMFKECMQVVPQFRVDKDVYTYLHGRNLNVLDYSDFIENVKDPNDDFSGMDRIESVYALNKFSTPITTYAHTPDEEKITALTQAF